MSITEESIRNRMEVLVEDVKTVRERIANAEKQMMDDKATLNALLGAYQQCEVFLKELDDDTPQEESDEE